MDQYYPNYEPDTYSIGPNYNMLFNNLRQNNEGFDVEIQIVENETITSFKVHSKLLLIFSPEFFDTLLSERWNTEKKPEAVESSSNSPPEVPEAPLRVVKMSVNPAIFSEILDFMYTGSITFRPANIQAVLVTAHYLQLTILHTHAQAYFELMLGNKPEVEKYQIYEQLASKYIWFKTTKLSRFGAKLYVFEKPTGKLTIIVKNIPDDRWMFADSLELIDTENPLGDSDVYVYDKNYIILHQTPTQRLNALPVTLGDLYYSGRIDRTVYICGSKPLGSQCFNSDTQKFTEFPLPARGINTFVNYVSDKMIFVVESGYLNVFEPISNQPGEWQEYELPDWKTVYTALCGPDIGPSTHPVVKLEMSPLKSQTQRRTGLPDGALAFFYSADQTLHFYFNTREKKFVTDSF